MIKHRSYISEGIILGKINLGEADKIITIFSKDYGKLSLVAKSVRRPKSKKRGHLEIFSNIRFQGVSGRSLDIITEAETINNFEKITANLKKISLAYYYCEVVNKITNEYEANSSLFNLLKKSLIKLTLTNGLKKQRFDFIHNLLTLTGFHPAGEKMINHDKILAEIIERNINSERVGKRMLQ